MIIKKKHWIEYIITPIVFGWRVKVYVFFAFEMPHFLGIEDILFILNFDKILWFFFSENGILCEHEKWQNLFKYLTIFDINTMK